MSTKVTNREELFERRPVWNAILTLTIPMILSSIVSMIYNLSDTYFVGQLQDSVQNAAVTLAAPAMTLFYGVTNLFGVGAASLMSRSMGAKDFPAVKKASATGIYFGLLFAALLSFVTLAWNRQTLTILGTDAETFDVTHDYMFWTVCLGSVPGIMSILFSYLLRAEGQSMHASVGQMSGCILNIILDPIFILPQFLNMGVAGAGLATFLANCAACSYFLILILKQKGRTYVCLNPRFVTVQKVIFISILIVGIPGVFQNVLNVVSMTILNNIAADYGPDAVAGIGIANKINQLPIQIVFGFSQGVMPLIGYNYASKNFPRMKEAIRKTFVLMLSALFAILVLFQVAGDGIVRIFMDIDPVVRVGASFLRAFGLSLPFMCMDFMVVGISMSFGLGRPALIFSFLRKVFLEIPFIYLLSHFFEVQGMAYAQCLTEVIMAMITAVVLRQLMKKTETVGKTE